MDPHGVFWYRSVDEVRRLLEPLPVDENESGNGDHLVVGVDGESIPLG